MLTESISYKQELKKYFGFNSFKGNQEDVIKSIIEEHDSFVIMPTGGGKSLCYQLPAMFMQGTAIIISPLIALMKNQVDSIRGISINEGIAHVLNSSLNKTQIATVKKDLIEGTTKLLYVAPESLTKQENIDFLNSIKISFYAIDEAHCISEWGHDFRPDYRNLKTIIQKIGKRPIVALTATATPKVQDDIQKNLGMNNAKVFKSSFNRNNLFYDIRPKILVEKEIIKYINQHKGKSGIIYCLSRKKVEEIAEVLQVNDIKALPYHAGLDSSTRTKHQDAFLMEDVDVIVATIAFGMGIDKPDVRFVIHHDIPKSLESYYQETGRCGRDGGEGNCIAFYSYKDIEKLEKFTHGKPIAEQEVSRQLLLETVSYVEAAMCRRKYLLHYFGEDFNDKHCNKMCDNCRSPKNKFEGKKEMLLMLESILQTKENFKAKDLVDFLTGKETSTHKACKSKKLNLFGLGCEKSDKFWHSVIRQAQISQLIVKEIESYGIIKLNEAGINYIKSPHSFMLIEDHNYEEQEEKEALANTQQKGSAFDPKLFNLLKDLRKKCAKEKNLPPYVLFQDPSLQDMSFQYPITMDELIKIAGVGNGKATKYGQPFIGLIKKYVDENDIDRPQDLVIKQMPKKSGLKVFIIQSTDKKLLLEDIAKAKSISEEELLTEIEIIVNSGTKIDISYYIDKLLEEEQQKEIIDYFMDELDDSIEKAYQEFDNEYSTEELRLMRIKFLSEVAN